MKSHYSFSTYKHHQQRQYTFKVYRKNAIINVQIKPNSGHDPKILRGIFTGFLQHALSFCSQQEEIDFLVQKFVDNGNQKHKLILTNFNERKASRQPTPSENTDPTQTVGYLDYLHNCGSHSEMQDIRLFSKARQTWSLFWHHTTNLNYQKSITDKKWDTIGVFDHASTCKVGFCWT